MPVKIYARYQPLLNELEKSYYFLGKVFETKL